MRHGEQLHVAFGFERGRGIWLEFVRAGSVGLRVRDRAVRLEMTQRPLCIGLGWVRSAHLGHEVKDLLLE